MPRRKSIASVEAKINKTKQEMESLKKRYDALVKQLKSLQEERSQIETGMIADALRKSGKSLDQLMTFLGR